MESEEIYVVRHYEEVFGSSRLLNLANRKRGDWAMVTSAIFSCAYCGEVNETTVDLSAGETQKYIEDCQVCCRANMLHVTGSRETDEAWIEALTEDD